MGSETTPPRGPTSGGLCRVTARNMQVTLVGSRLLVTEQCTWLSMWKLISEVSKHGPESGPPGGPALYGMFSVSTCAHQAIHNERFAGIPAVGFF